jgi:hypothetical protein
MQVVNVDQDGKTTIVCEHCQNLTYAFNPVNPGLLAIAHCGACKRNAKGELNTFDLQQFLKNGGK